MTVRSQGWASAVERIRPGSTTREAQKSASRKPTEVGGVEDCGKVIETPVNKGRSRIGGYPRCGEGCGDTLTKGIFFKDRSSFRQRGPPVFVRSASENED